MKNIIFISAVLAVLSVSCTKQDEGEHLLSRQQTLSGKLISQGSGEIAPGSVLVKLDEEAVAEIEQGHFAKISESLLAGIEATSFEPALAVRPKNREAARRHGLHQWFLVRFEESTSPEAVAARLAKSDAVRSIQYNRYVERVSSPLVHPLEETPVLTKTSVQDASLPFNDPYLEIQWNLINDGSVKGSKAGADIGVKDAWRLTGGDPSVVVAVFDDAFATEHEDLEGALWTNDKEVAGTAGTDDDGNGFIDDKYGFNFVGLRVIDANYIGAWVGGRDSTAIKGDPLYSFKGTGHGTHVAGIIGAVNGNGKGVSSIAGGTGNNDGVRLMACQIFTDKNPTDAQRAAAYIYAADNGACIAQCSYGQPDKLTTDELYTNQFPLEKAALDYFLDKSNSNHPALDGNIAVFAAGNHSNPYSIYPGALTECISVTSFGCDYLPGGYSNYGPGCKIAAPGGEYSGISGDYSTMILSTGVQSAKDDSGASAPGVTNDKGREDRNYVYMQGTSMACPHVSGVLALGISYAHKLGKKFSREEMTSMLLTSVNDIDQYLESGTKRYYSGSTGGYVQLPLNQYKGKMGTGAADAWKFLMAIEGTPSVMVKTGEKARIDLAGYCSPSATYTLSMDEASRKSLGVEEGPAIKDGYLEITCSKIGSGKIRLESSVGKDHDREDGIGSMAYSREISIVTRPFATRNGGWL